MVATEVAEWTNSGRLFHREGGDYNDRLLYMMHQRIVVTVAVHNAQIQQ